MDYRPIVGTTSEWSLNDKIIPAREVAIEVQSDGKYVLKVGDGETLFSALPGEWEGYLNGGNLAAEIEEVRNEVRPIQYGGTGAATVEAALANLGAAPAMHTHPAYLTAETDPTVPAWAKAGTKPSYTAAEVGASPTGHTHNYAGAASSGAAATSALKLNTARSIGLSGVTATAQNFDGTEGITVPITAVPTSLLTGAVDVAHGGTGATDAATARANLGVTLANLGASAVGHTHSEYLTGETDPTVPAWAKELTKPSYTAAEVGAAAVSHAHAQSDVTGLGTSLGAKADKKVPAVTGNIATLDAAGNLADGGVDISGLATSGHDHNYAGAATPGGAATLAVELQTARSIGLSGVTATSQNFDGTGNVTIPVTAVPATLLTGAVSVANGGTGATDASTARTNLGVTLGNLGAAPTVHGHALTDANVTGVLPIVQGGTGQTTAALARNALGLGNTTGAVPIANGGTGATDAVGAISNLGAVNKEGDTLTGALISHTGDDYSTSRLRNIALVTSVPTVSSSNNGWLYGIYTP